MNDSDKDYAGKTSALKVSGAGFQEFKGTTAKAGTAVVTGLRVLYTPKAGFNGAHEFTYTAQDKVGHSCSAKVRVTVRAASLGGATTTNGAGEGTAGSSEGTLSCTGPAMETARLLTLAALLLLAGTAALRAAPRTS